jgi:multiple sugar transport system permease protein
VHVLPAIGGLAISFKKFNLFTFRELFGAPWNGLENYRSILLDTDNPLHTGFWGAVSNTAVYTFWTVAGTLVGGWPSRCCSTARCAASAWRGR